MKQKTLFDHIKQITAKSDTSYYDKLSDEDKKTFSTFMVHRYLSMNENWIEAVNSIQQYSQELGDRGVYKVYDEIIPKGNTFLKYVKSKNDLKYNKEVIEILKKHFEIGESQAKEYYDLYTKSPSELQSLIDIIKLYGIQEKEFKKMEKDLLIHE